MYRFSLGLSVGETRKELVFEDKRGLKKNWIHLARFIVYLLGSGLRSFRGSPRDKTGYGIKSSFPII